MKKGTTTGLDWLECSREQCNILYNKNVNAENRYYAI